MLTQAKLKQLLRYDPMTGKFTRLVSYGHGVSVGDIAGSTNNQGYESIRVLGKAYAAHRLAWLYMEGVWPNIIDHINGVRNCNKWANLREATNSINNQNRHKANRTSAVGLLGVTSCGKRFRANIHCDGKKLHIGVFVTAEDAYAAYVRKKREIHQGCTL